MSNIDLSKMSVKELIEICKKEKITKYSNKKKEDLIKIINNKNINMISLPISSNQPTSLSLLEIKKDKNIDNSTYEELKKLYNEVLNTDKSTYKSSNDEPTPINCVEEMINKIPDELWKRSGLKILDPCCGNGNFSLPIIQKLIEQNNDKKAK